MGTVDYFRNGQRRFEQLVNNWSVVDVRKLVIVARYAGMDVGDRE